MTRPAAVLRILLLAALAAASPPARAAEPAGRDRPERVERALQYLYSIQKDGAVGDSRHKAVTPLFVLACLSADIPPADPRRGEAVGRAAAWMLDHSATQFLGGNEEPHADHALAALMLVELTGTAADRDTNIAWHRRARLAVDYALRIQDKGVGAEYFGGWRRNDTTRVNDRMLTAWYLHLLHAAGLRGLPAPASSLTRAVDFVAASQKLDDPDTSDQRGGFSVDAHGLAVRSTTAAGLAVLALHDPENERAQRAAMDWLERHPPQWHGPHFYESNFFAARGLFRVRHLDGGRAFDLYFGRLVQLLAERQEPDASFPFPPGHGGPIVAMGHGYSTAMAVLILNTDRGVLPLDK